jgi:hypothetical protein
MCFFLCCPPRHRCGCARSQRRIKHVNEETRRKASKPLPLSSKRPRALTIGGATVELNTWTALGKKSGKQITLSQDQSLLFSIPVEIRDQIWRSLLCGNVIHITQRGKKLIHLVCTCPETFGYLSDPRTSGGISYPLNTLNLARHRCWGNLVSCGAGWYGPPPLGDPQEMHIFYGKGGQLNPMNILMLCRRVLVSPTLSTAKRC